MTSAAGRLRAAWRARLRWHAALLLVGMVAVGAYIGSHSVFTDDEANVVLQARAVAHGEWALPDPFPQVDPRQQDFAAENVTSTAAGIAPIPKHLTYILLVAPVVGLAGAAGLMGVSMVCTLVAALCSAWLARIYAPGRERAAFWVTALASPLFFYSFVLTGQTAGAAAAAVSMVAGLAYLRSGRCTALVSSGAAIGLAVAAREEAMIWCIASCVAAPLLARRRRNPAPSFPRRRIGLLVLSLAAGGFLARLSDLILAHVMLGNSQPVSQQASALLGGNTLASQIRGVLIATLGAGDAIDPLAQGNQRVLALTVGGLALAAIAALAARMLGARYPATIPAAAGALAATCFAARLLTEPTSPVSGLFPAFPVLWAGLWLIGRAELSSPEARWAAGASVVFATGVAASIYSDGGGLQWGGRYFGLALPVIIPLVMAGFDRYGTGMAADRRRLLGCCLAAATMASACQAVATLDGFHRGGTAALSELAGAAADAPAGDGGRPVVVSTSAALGSIIDAYPRYRMLRPPDESALTDLGLRLRADGVHRIIVAGYAVERDEKALSGSYRVVSGGPRLPDKATWRTAVLESLPG